MESELGEHLEAEAVARLESLELIARVLVEGFLKGIHLSVARGSSSELAEHRPYVPGDDIRRIDWRTFGRTDRYYLRENEDETNVRATILLDASASMGFTSGSATKLRIGQCLSAALAYLLYLQRDAVGLAVAGDRLRRHVPPRSTAQHLRGIFGELEGVTAAGETHLGECLHALAEGSRGRGMAIVISDFLDDPSAILRGTAHLRHRGADVLLFHILDPAEEELPFTGWMVFEDGEQPGRRLRLDARQVKETYLENLRAHLEAIQKGAAALGADHVLLGTRRPFEPALARLLDARSRRGKR